MAEGHRMTAAHLADKLLADEHADVLRHSLAWIVAELMEAEVSAQIGATHGERTPDRVTHRNGYRTRHWDTRVWVNWSWRSPNCARAPTSPASWSRAGAEQALVAVVQEAYVNGVSTRKVDRLVEQLGGRRAAGIPAPG